MKYIMVVLCTVLIVSSAIAACNCGSTDSSNPCTGQAIDVTVVAGTPNGGTPVNNIYNWSFNSGGGDARCGQFASGDYWVAPAAGQTTVTVTGVGSTSHSALIKADVDPTTESVGLLSSTQTYYNYNDSQNIIPTLPQSYYGINSIVAAIQRNESVEGICGTGSIEGNCADSYNVVTVLPSIPENAGSTVLRPNITGENKELITFSDLDFTKLPSKTYLAGSDSTARETIRRRWSHSTEIFALRSSLLPNYSSEGGRAWRAHTLVDDYGSGYATYLYNDIAALMSSGNTLVEKKPALAAILSFGLDIYHAKYDPPAGVSRYWGSGAGQHPGRFIAPALLASLLIDQTKATVLKTAYSTVTSSAYAGPQEMQQASNTGPNGPLYGDYDDTEGGYWNELLKSNCFDGGLNDGLSCPYVTGKRTGRDPYGYVDGVGMIAGGGYTSISLGTQKSLVGMMFMSPEICNIVNYPQLVAFTDRYLSTHGVQASGDPCVTPDTREDKAVCDPYRNGVGCNYYRITWGPDPANPGSCIKTPTPPYTRQGRFASEDGKTMIPTASYTSALIRDHWGEIRGSEASCGSTEPPITPTCIDGIKNGEETGIDCGGGCLPCDVLQDIKFMPWKDSAGNPVQIQ